MESGFSVRQTLIRTTSCCELELTAGRRLETAVPDDVMTTAGLREPLA